MEAIEPCPIHSDLFEESLVHNIPSQGMKKEYIYTWSSTLVLWKGQSALLLVAPKHGHSHLGIYSLQHPILLLEPASQRQQRSPQQSARKGTHSLPVALARPPNLDATPWSASKFESISIEDQRQILQHENEFDAPFSISSSSESASN